uniref:E3 ubiquitin-protein ligase listerin n=1 Tax=Electrophorus electricus TaxID=8005 RepID=A0A4W4E597_ELEEL
MGGKNKQRTKGNVRPSSSGRAAELLARESGSVPGFVGFGISTSNDPGYVPAVHGAEEIDNLVDADFRLVLRKLSKRDTVTKLKAVQEFGAMCQERESDVVRGVLPYWPRIYCKISVDHDRRVREAAQQAFEQLILKVKRNLAPYLKGLMGHWLVAQCDTYSPAASAAAVAFQAAFPLSKQPEALSFCKEEVLNVLQDNLLKETADTLSDPQSVPEEEREAKYMRLLTSSLLALKRLLTVLPQSDCEALAKRLANIIAQGKFWKYSKHKSPQVRGALFELVAALCELTPQLLQAEAARVCSAVLLGIDDSDPVVLPPLWEAVLHVISSIQDCWSHVNVRKGVLPKLWALLAEGGRGLATVLHPNMLPFLSKLPAEVTEPKLHFCTTFFSSITQGLASERALASPSECAAIVYATMECLRFVLLQSVAEGAEQRALQSLLPLIDKALGTPALQRGPLFPQISEMLVSWEKRVTGDEAAAFQRLLTDFWEGLGSLCARRVDCEETEPAALEGIASLLEVMYDPDNPARKQAKGKKAVKICFAEQEGKGEEDGPSAGRPVTEPADGFGKRKPPPPSGHLLELVCQLAELSVVYVCERDSEKHLRFLALLLRAFPRPQVFGVLLGPGHGKVEPDTQLGALAQNPAVRFLLQRVALWLRQDDGKDTDLLVDMVFSALRCCGSNTEQTLVLNRIAMDLKWGVLLQIVQKACANAGHLELCGGWLRDPVLGERLVRLAGELCTVGLEASPSAFSALPGQHSHSWALISLALSQQHNNEPLIGKVYVERIIERLHATLSEAKGMCDAGNMEPLVSFISDVASNFFSSVKGCLLLPAANDLLLTTFQLCAQDPALTHLSDALLQKLKLAYTAGVHSLVTHLGPGVTKGTFLHSAAAWVKRQLLTSILSVQRYHSRSSPHRTELELQPCWIKRPLLAGRLRACGDCPCMEVWSVRASGKLPAHLCASALLGRIIFIAVPVGEQQEETDTSVHPDLIAEILYALQWCEEMEHCSAMVAEYHQLLQEWNVAENACSPSLAEAGDLGKASAAELALPVEMMRFLCWLVDHSPTVLCSTHWDFLLCSMLAWLEIASESSGSFWNPWVQQFVCANCELIAKLTEFFAALPAGLAEQLPPELSSEWQEFFVEGVYTLLLPLLKFPTAEFPEPDEQLFPLAVAEAVGEALVHMPVRLLTHNKLPARFVAGQRSSLPDGLQSLLNTLTPLLIFKARPLQLAVYHMLHKVMPLLPESDCERANAKSDDEEEEEPSLSPPAAIMSILTTTEELLESILGSIQVGEFAVVVPLSTEHCCILGYLLAWKLLLTFFKAAPSQNGSIMEGLSLWKNNVEKRFEGVEDCMICFSVIHGSNYSLPKKACRTCKKKFHSACLYKWFTSSNKSTCPLCRDTFF